jgi:hypothetical protein
MRAEPIPPVLEFRQDGDRGQAQPNVVRLPRKLSNRLRWQHVAALDCRRAEQHVADDPARILCNERHDGLPPVGEQGNQPCLLVTWKRRSMDGVDAGDIGRASGSDGWAWPRGVAPRRKGSTPRLGD